MRKFVKPLISAAMLLILGFAAIPANGQALPSVVDSSPRSANGLIVRYAEGVHRVAPDGQATGENFAGVSLGAPRDLGDGLVALTFEKSLSNLQAQQVLAQIQKDPRIVTAQIDETITFDQASVSAKRRVASKPWKPIAQLATFAGFFEPLAAQRAASAPLSLRVLNAVSPASPRTPRLKLTWVAPKSLYGAKIVGYRIERRLTTATNWSVAISNTARTFPSAYVTAGLSVGLNTYYRVKAITQSKNSTVYSIASSMKSFAAKVAPIAPQLTSANVIFASERASWLEQNLNQRGGDSVIYTAVATSATGKSFECTTVSNSCAISGLSANVAYSLQVSAKNSVATAATDIVEDPLYKTQWYLYSKYSVHADRAWPITQGSNTVVVAVLDSGITSHPDLEGKILPGYDFISDKTSSRDSDGWDSDPTDRGDWSASEDSSWHGTHVAGIVAASANAIGVRGVAPQVKILPLRVLGTKGGAQSDLIAAIHWASGISVAGVPDNANPAKVINLSLGTASTQSCDVGTQSAVRSAWDAGATPVTAAGNAGFEASRSYPGNCYPTINVGATGFTGDLSTYSNYGSGIDFSAPGGDSNLSSSAVAGSEGMILSTWNLGKKSAGQADYGLEEGTSMAAPVVSGVVALIYSVRPDLSSEDVYNVLKATVQQFKPDSECAVTAPNYGSQNEVSHCGAGIVDAAAAVKFAISYESTG